MKNKIKILMILGLFSASWVSFAEDYLDPTTRIPFRSIFYMDIENQIYYTDSNFYSNSESWTGSILDYINDNERLILTDHKIALSYRPMKWIQITPHVRAKNFFGFHSRVWFLSPTEAGITLNSPIRASFIGFLPSFEFVFPLDKQNSIERPILSDETVAFNLSLFSQFYIFRKWIPFGKVAFQYRGRELMSLFQGQAGIKYRDHFWEVGTLYAFQNPIPSQNTPQRKSHLLNQFNAGSLKYFVNDPFSMGISIWADARIGKKTHFLTIVSTDINGVNYAQGYSINFGLKYKFIERAKRKRKSYRFQEKIQNIDSLLNENDRDLLREIEKIQ